MENARPIETEPLIEKIAADPVPSLPPLRKRPLLAGFLALFPGMGNVYNGLYLRGIVFFSIIASLLAIGTSSSAGDDHPVLGFVVAFVWIFNVIDSVRQAQLINLGYCQDLGLDDLPKVPKAGQGGLLAGLLLVALGVIASLQYYFHVDLSWMVKLWPIAILAIGSGLIYAWYRERKGPEEP